MGFGIAALGKGGGAVSEQAIDKDYGASEESHHHGV